MQPQPTKKRGPSLFEVSQRFKTPEDCLKFLEELRWPDGAICPRSRSPKVCRLYARALFECYTCRKQFSATCGTILHGTDLPLQKGIRACQLPPFLKCLHSLVYS